MKYLAQHSKATTKVFMKSTIKGQIERNELYLNNHLKENKLVMSSNESDQNVQLNWWKKKQILFHECRVTALWCACLIFEESKVFAWTQKQPEIA